MTDEQPAANDTATEHKGATALQLPLARVKRMIKADTDLCPFSTDANVLITKATELFIDYIVKKAYENTHREERKIVQYKDVATSVENNAPLDFLLDVIPRQKTLRELNES